ncbi:MAG: hypothetical protein QM662_02395 [Gordonia sp. (in: high G+C Gram-positive bacteria)]
MSDATDALDGAQQLRKASLWGKTPRKLAAEYSADNSAQYARPAIERTALEVSQKHASRSPYRSGDGLVDTWAGMDLYTNADVHALLTERGAEYGDQTCLTKIQNAAGAGNARATAFLAWLAAGGARTVVAARSVRAAAGLSEALPESVAEVFSPARRQWLHVVTVSLLALIGVLVPSFDNGAWGALVAGAVLAVFDLGTAILHSKSGVRTAVYALLLAVQPIALGLHLGTGDQWAAALQVITAVFGGALAAAKTRQP